MIGNPSLGESFVDQDGRLGWYGSDGMQIFRGVDNGHPAAFNAPDGRPLFVYENPAARPPVTHIEMQRPKRDWPVLDAAAYHGLAGDTVRVIAPETEADPAALLTTFLILFGNVCDRSAHAVAGGSRHYLNEFAAIVGDTAKGRKGSSAGHLLHLFDCVDSTWRRERIAGGLSSGEGLISTVRDASDKADKNGKLLDLGAADKRLLVIEEELASTLKIMSRDGNTLSAIIRQAWDSGDLRVLTRHDPMHATGAHISLLGHITAAELQRYLTETEAANGFANRIIWICSRRAHLLPDGGGDPNFRNITDRLHAAIDFASSRKLPLRRDEEARKEWHRVYEPLSEGKLGLLGAVLGRAEAHVLRLSLLYAMLDQSDCIGVEHQRAALALWQYSEDSAKYIFGERLGDPIADIILDALTQAGEAGMTRTQVSVDLFGRNQSAGRIATAISQLTEAGLITALRVPSANTGGAPITKYLRGSFQNRG